MKKYIVLLVAFLGALELLLFWVSGIIDERAKAAHAAGMAECKAEQSQMVVNEFNKRQEVQNVQTRKTVIVWSRPNSHLNQLIKRMREQGIGIADNYSKDNDLSDGRK